MHYKDNVIQFVQVADGRFQFATSKYQYDLTDHLGNVRVTVEATRDNANTQSFTHSSDICLLEAEQTLTLFSNPGIGVLDVSVNLETQVEQGGLGQSSVTIYEGDRILASVENYFAPGTVHTVSFADLLLTGEGDLTIKLGDTSAGLSTCFSNVQADYTPVLVDAVQKDDYFPFGLTFNHWQKDPPENLYQFQGQEYQKETGWSSFKWRNAMPELGRFFNVDPLAEDYLYNSPYAFSENKVTAHIELEGLESWYVADGNLITKQFSNQPASGPLSTSYAQSIGATEYGVMESQNGYSFSDQEVQDFSDWNLMNGPSEPGKCIGVCTTGAEMLTGQDAGFRNSNGQNDFGSGGTVREDGRVTVYDVGINLENSGSATEIATQQGQETNSIVNNSNTSGTENTVYIAGIAGAYHSLTIVRNTSTNEFSLYDQGTIWSVQNTTQTRAQSEINSINSNHPTWGSRIWQLNKPNTVEVKYPVSEN